MVEAFPERNVQAPREKPRTILPVIKVLPNCFTKQACLLRKAQGVADFRERRERDIQKPSELPSTFS